LDLACGTAAASLVFAAAGHRVVGVDRAAEMLEQARGKTQRAGLDVRFVERDLRELAGERWPEAFDLAVCFFDSLNYLTGDDDLRRVCAGVAAALRPGGSFVFDLNTEAEFATWNERAEVVRDDGDFLVYNRLNYDEERRLATGRVVWFRRAMERWWRDEELHVERAWSADEVRAALAAAGLTLLARLTPEGAQAPNDAPRVVYYARREV
jgi:SAM-dependent methyltransferase